MININDKILTLKDQQITVLGAGLSGIYAAALAASFGAKVRLSDSQKISLSNDQADLLKKYHVQLEENGHSARIYASDFIIKSPGIPNSGPLIKKIKNQDIPVIGEIEFAYQILETDKIVAVTGSNGKTTTTTMVSELLKTHLDDVHCGGNIGNPLSKIILEQTIDEESVIVLELSSFQLEDIGNFRPYIALFLNISEDHLDRYDNQLGNYLKAKLRIAKNQCRQDYFIYYSNDKILSKNLPQNVTPVPFALDNKESGIYLKDNTICYNNEKFVTVDDLKINGLHNTLNLIAALNVCKIFAIPAASMTETVRNFQTPEHRLEFVDEIAGVKYYNDSKATNVESVKMALTAFPGNVILILGGRDKNANFSLLADDIQAKVKKLILTGEAAEVIQQQLPEITKPAIEKDFQQAVERAKKSAKPGDIVLLSPACASFDAFKNFEERGRVFKQIVKGLNR